MKPTYSEPWIILPTNLSKPAVRSIRSLPAAVRKFDVNVACWIVHKSKRIELEKILKQWYQKVDMSCIPVVTKETSSLYRKLHLTPDAPVDLVKAAFKVLSKKFHPDVGGDNDKFLEVAAAYSEIMSGRS